MAKYEYINATQSVKDTLRKACKVYTREELSNIKDIEIKEAFANCDYVVFFNDYDFLIKNSRLQTELEKIDNIKIVFTNFNNCFLRENGKSETDELEETCDREIINRALTRNLKNRKIKYTRSDAIYMRNKEEESYSEVKSYFLNYTLSWQFNKNFEAITRKLKKAIPAQRQQYTIFRPIFINTLLTNSGFKKVGMVFDELRFNNEAFNKGIYKLFIPYTTHTIGDLFRIAIPEIEEYDDYREWYSRGAESDKIINLQEIDMY